MLALGLTVYPIVSTAYNEKHQSEIHTQYQEMVEKTDQSALLHTRKQAQAYNLTVRPGAQDAFEHDTLVEAAESYGGLLNLGGDGIMGYVEIPKIHVRLPIYHGTNNSTLELGIGHLLGSSLPIGGENTHTVLTAHSGMASQKMFSDLPQLQIGDVYYLDVLGERLAYQVDQINTVLPHDTTFLGIENGQDQCTLVTCTPFGVNTHRLLVRGSRIPYEEAEAITEEAAAEEESVATWEQEYFKGVLLGLSLVALAGTVLLVIHFHRRGHYEAP